MVTLIKVESTRISEIGYIEKEAKLLVRFKDGGWLYEYDPVPPIVYLGLKECRSKGHYLQTQVIPYFRARRVK